MPVMTVVLRDPPWPDLNTLELVHLGEEHVIQVAGLDAGMESGRPSVALKFDLPDGRVVLAETSLALFLSAADVLKARHGDPRGGF